MEFKLAMKIIKNIGYRSGKILTTILKKKIKIPVFYLFTEKYAFKFEISTP
jgi:hypothetical protein